MRVRMKIRIGGYRNLVEWPGIGGEIDLPDPEALDLIAVGYAEAVEPESDPEHEPEPESDEEPTGTVDGSEHLTPKTARRRKV